MSSSRDDYPKFSAADTEVLGISSNVRFSQKAFADFLKLNYPLLSDAPGNVMKAYDVYDDQRRTAKRSYFIIDKQGVVRFAKVMEKNSELMSNDELLKEINKLK